MHMAVQNLYLAKWTNAIHDEWIASVARDRRDLAMTQLRRTRDLMNAHVPDCLVTGFESLIETLTLPDPEDRHVAAAALHCGAQVVLTFNLGDFPRAALGPHGIVAQHPDEFLARQHELAPHVVCAAANRHWASLKKPPKSVAEYLATLESQGLPQTVAMLRRFEAVL